MNYASATITRGYKICTFVHTYTEQYINTDTHTRETLKNTYIVRWLRWKSYSLHRLSSLTNNSPSLSLQPNECNVFNTLNSSVVALKRRCLATSLIASQSWRAHNNSSKQMKSVFPLTFDCGLHAVTYARVIAQDFCSVFGPVHLSCHWHYLLGRNSSFGK